MNSIEVPVLSKKELKSYGLMMGAVVAGLFGLLLPLLFSRPFKIWPWAVAVFFWSMAIIFPSGLRGIHKLWMRFGHFMGKINTTILLSVFYAVLFVPIAVCLKLLGRDRLARSFRKQDPSFRVLRTVVENKERWERPF